MEEAAMQGDAEERFAPLTWRAPDGARVYGREHDAPIPSDAPIDSGPIRALQAWRADPRSFTPTMPPPFAPVSEQAASPPHLPVPVPPPMPASRAWPVHLGPARPGIPAGPPPEDAAAHQHATHPPEAQSWAPPPVEWRPPPSAPLPKPVQPHELPEEVDVVEEAAPSAFEGEVNLAAIESARSLAWTAVALALFLPPVGIGVGWFCLGIARRSSGLPGCAAAASRLRALALLSLLLGCAALTAWIVLLVAVSR